jgi:histone H3/H4
MSAAEDACADAGEGVREQDKFLPIANINRIMKEALPHSAKVSKDAKELVQQCVSDFIIYITSQYVFTLHSTATLGCCLLVPTHYYAECM